MKYEIKNEVYWYTKKAPLFDMRELKEDKAADVVVIGGGAAGLSAAQTLQEQGKKVILLEATFVGGAASGKSSGFITPDSELQLSDLLSSYGEKIAKKLRVFANDGVHRIRTNIQENNIDCDYQSQDSLFIANAKADVKEVKEEHEAREKLGYQSIYHTQTFLKEVLPAKNYFGAVQYGDTFGMNSYLYCQGMKDVLQKKGVEIYEQTPVLEINDGEVRTKNGIVKAPNIVVATDAFLPKLNIQKQNVYHAQTFLAVSKSLSAEQIEYIFPKEKMMAWDTDLIYQYYRIVEGNRLLMGAASMIYTYELTEKLKTPERIIKKMHAYLKEKFPKLQVEFEYSWPGFIGVTKDFVPIAGEDADMKGVYFISGATGIPWAVALGNYIADKIISGSSEYDSYFSPNRKFAVPASAQFVLRKPLSFAINHGIVKYFK